MTSVSTESCPDRPTQGWRLLVASIAFIGSYFVAVILQEVLELGRLAGLAVSLFPVVGFLFFLLEEVRVVRQLDELHKRIQLEALATGFPAAMLLLMLMGFLQRVDLLPHALSTIRDVWGFLPLCYFIGLFFARRRYL